MSPEIFSGRLSFVLLIGLLFFYQELQHSYCVVNGTTYTGLRAIQMNRQITEEFKGVLTDEKIERIIEKYGFPQGAPDDYSRQKDNFLNHFIMEYASDGYNNGQDDYRPATKTIPLRETELGRYHEAAGMALRLEYYIGWSLFPDTLGILMLGASMLVLYVVSVVFSEEEQTGMKPCCSPPEKGRPSARWPRPPQLSACRPASGSCQSASVCCFTLPRLESTAWAASPA